MRSRENGIGALRLLFAALVIASHTPEIIDGDQHREVLHWAFGTDLTFGAVAVDGFFLISGYLITASYLSKPRGYLWRRIQRIFPGFLACMMVSVLVVAPLAGVDLSALHIGDWRKIILHLAKLEQPNTLSVFPGTHYATLNGSVWSIAYEFRCYLLTLTLGAMGLLRKPRAILALTVSALVAYVAVLPHGRLTHWPLQSLIGDGEQVLRLGSAYLVGGCFKLYEVKFRGWVALLGATALVPLLFSPRFAQPALIVFGGYVLFWCAFNVKARWFLTLNAKDDISYGLYLYAWPIEKLLLWGRPLLGIWPAGLLTLALSAVAGFLSWKLVEQPALRLKPRHSLSRLRALTVTR